MELVQGRHAGGSRRPACGNGADARRGGRGPGPVHPGRGRHRPAQGM